MKRNLYYSTGLHLSPLMMFIVSKSDLGGVSLHENSSVGVWKSDNRGGGEEERHIYILKRAAPLKEFIAPV